MTISIGNRTDIKGSFLGATLLISGTCIGGGMLAMPVQTAETGFFLTLLCIITCWAFMTFTGLLLVEATLWVRGETHFASLSRILVGNKTKGLALLVYLFMNYASLVAYTAGGSQIVTLWAKALTGLTVSYEVGCVIFTLLFGLLVFLGTHLVSRLNLLLMFALIFSYISLIGFGVGSVRGENLIFRPHLGGAFGIVSMILATFSYQMVVPSVCSYLKYDTQMLKRAVITGTTLPFAVYSLWLFIIHGCVPMEGTNGLLEAFKNGSAATLPLRVIFNHWSLSLLVDFFAFFAIATSYLGLSLALLDFLRDCFREFKLNISKNHLMLITIIPTLMTAILFPRALIKSLDLSGGFGDTILSGLIPIGMVWIGRYRKNLSIESRTPGGKPALFLAASFFAFFFILQIVQLWQ
jgi:tyrosine-specific transport protein